MTAPAVNGALSVNVTGSEETMRAIRQRAGAFRKASIVALRSSSEIVLGRALENVSGRILHIRSGTLANRLHYQVFEAAGIAKVGSPVKYAAIHEYGGTIKHPGGTAYYFIARTGLARWLSNKKAAGHNFPRTKAHDIVMPARPWLRPALEDSRADIEKQFATEIDAAIKGGS